MITIGIIVYLAIGFYMLRFEKGWLIMLTDDRNVRNTWLAIPALILCWILWPLIRVLPMWLFLFMWRFGL